MTRAGKEPAEDAKRAIIRAIGLAGLKVHRVRMFKGEGVAGRFIMCAANPEGWAHECPALGMHTFVDFTGEIGQVEIRCSATDEDPLMNALTAPTLRHCSCELDRLPETLQAVWKERQVIIDRATHGEGGSRFVGRWVWEAPEEPDVGL
jgi:hypothetical protein